MHLLILKARKSGIYVSCRCLKMSPLPIEGTQGSDQPWLQHQGIPRGSAVCTGSLAGPHYWGRQQPLMVAWRAGLGSGSPAGALLHPEWALGGGCRDQGSDLGGRTTAQIDTTVHAAGHHPLFPLKPVFCEAFPDSLPWTLSPARQVCITAWCSFSSDHLAKVLTTC